MQVRDVLAAVDRLAPFGLAEPWDHVGLQVGSGSDRVSGVMVTLEVDDAALDAARDGGCDLLLVHHPLIFDPLERLSDDSEAGRLALRAARDGVTVIAAHTSLDKARGGIADVVAGMLGLDEAAPLAPVAADSLKLVGFVPADDADLVRKALFAAGAGAIGEYEHCSWAVEGQGTFFGREGTDPTVGQAGRDESVAELRLEVVFPRRLRRRVTGAYVAAHPYEEPAYDVYPVENEIASLGLGRLGEFAAARPLAAFAAEVASVLGLPSLRYAGDGKRLVKRVAVLPGSGAEAIARGVAQVADVLVTGDVKYHEARAAQAQGLALIDAPHGVAEQEAVLRWAETVAEALGTSVGSGVAPASAPASGPASDPGVRVETFRNPNVHIWKEAAVAATTEPATAQPAATVPAAPGGAPSSSTPPSPALESTPNAEPGPKARPAAPCVNPDDDRFHLYTDGGARGNPGPAGIGAVLLTAAGDVVEDLADSIGTATNNVAEYQALIAGLEMALDRHVERLDAFLDSELVVRQVNGQYKVKDAGLKPLHAQACVLLSKFHEVDVKHVRREQNSAADALVNQAIDAATS